MESPRKHLGLGAVLPTLFLIGLAMAGCASEQGAQQEADAQPRTQSTPPEHVEGEKVYKQKCSLCHKHGEAGAPKLGNAKQWAKRTPQGLDTLVDHAMNGFEGMWGEMPAQGDDLTQDQVTVAVEYMLYESEKSTK